MQKLIALDYLEVNFQSKLIAQNTRLLYEFNKICYIQFTDKQTSNFSNIAKLYINSSLVGELRFNPRNSINHKETILFKFENSTLYSNAWHNTFLFLVNELKFKFIHTTRCDIAVDCIRHNILDFLNEYDTQNTNNKHLIKQKGKANITFQKDNKRNLQIVYVGNIRTKNFKVYNKSKELNISNKDYISEFWKVNKLDYSNNEVERIELSLKQVNCKNINIDNLLQSSYLCAIFHQNSKNFFEFSKTYNDNKKYTKNVTPIDFKFFESIKLDKSFKSKALINNIATIKRTIKNLYINQLIDSNSYTNKTIQNLVSKNKLNAWYASKVPYWHKEYLYKTNEYCNILIEQQRNNNTK